DVARAARPAQSTFRWPGRGRHYIRLDARGRRGDPAGARYRRSPLPPSRRLADDAGQRAHQVLLGADAGVRDLPLRVEDHHVGGGGRAERAGGAAVRVPEDAPGRIVALLVAPDRALRLVDRHGHEQDLDVVAEAGPGGVELGLQLLAERAPGGPELDQDRLLADVLAQVHGRAVQVLDLDGGR